MSSFVSNKARADPATQEPDSQLTQRMGDDRVRSMRDQLPNDSESLLKHALQDMMHARPPVLLAGRWQLLQEQTKRGGQALVQVRVRWQLPHQA